MDISQARDSTLVHQDNLDGPLRRAYRLLELRPAEAIRQRITSQRLDCVELEKAIRPRRLKPAKHARVPEVNHRVVIKHKPGAAVRLDLSSRALHEFAGHSQVGEQAAVAVECQQQVLAPPVGLEQLASHLFEELSICPSEDAALLRFGANQLAIAEPLFQIPSFDFYFGQLGHARSLAPRQ